MGEFSLVHWVVLFAIVLLIFGPKRLPELAKALGSGIRDFKKALNPDDSAHPQQQPQITQARPLSPEPPATTPSNAHPAKDG